MALRVYIEEDKAPLFRALKASDGEAGVFQTHGDILTFAAVLGFKRQRRKKLGKRSTKNPDPVLQDQFRDPHIINLIAVLATGDPKILATNEECDKQRITIFEEYANGGLEILQDELKGVVNYLDKLLLILSQERDSPSSLEEEEFDLTSFL
ncbi:MAG: DNA phosphorothioation-associated protein 4 [Cyanobacteria bacterium]|nr:DNA phosphorothioation-associated protein 4 [Cyanobacteriota bacterium]MDW8200276.1 DNA phosphorothioation-associated protein 4 [Cyanobacteriota bacterium SKYGB_h_bin112]